MSRFPHLWMRFGDPTRCGKCGAFVSDKADRIGCDLPDSPGARLLREIGRPGRVTANETTAGTVPAEMREH